MTDMDKVKISTDELHLFAVEYAFIDKQLNTVGQAMEKFMTGFLKKYGRVSLGLTEEEELDDHNFPVTTTLYEIGRAHV